LRKIILSTHYLWPECTLSCIQVRLFYLSKNLFEFPRNKPLWAMEATSNKWLSIAMDKRGKRRFESSDGIIDGNYGFF
jgi:hypothetical protein